MIKVMSILDFSNREWALHGLICHAGFKSKLGGYQIVVNNSIESRVIRAFFENVVVQLHRLFLLPEQLHAVPCQEDAF